MLYKLVQNNKILSCNTHSKCNLLDSISSEFLDVWLVSGMYVLVNH